MTDDPDLRPYAYAEVAILAGVSVQTIRRRVKAGWLIRVPGSQGLLTRRSVHRWLNGVVGYDADSDGQGEGPGDGGPDHAVPDRAAPLAGRGHGGLAVTGERHKPWLYQRWGAIAYRNARGVPMFSIGIHVDLHTPRIDFHMPDYTLTVGRIMNPDGPRFVRHTADWAWSGHTDDCWHRQVRS